MAELEPWSTIPKFYTNQQRSLPRQQRPLPKQRRFATSARIDPIATTPPRAPVGAGSDGVYGPGDTIEYENSLLDSSAIVSQLNTHNISYTRYNFQYNIHVYL